MAKQSAGILCYRIKDMDTEVFLVHPGGPFWKNKDERAWSIPKGEFDHEEDAFHAALREFEEETGIKLTGDFIQLEPVKQKSGKVVYTWAIRFDIDPSSMKSNLFTIEWPPGSGKQASFPETDKAAWFPLETARKKIVSGQDIIINELQDKLT